MYTTEVTLLDFSGSVTLPLIGKLWELSTVIDGQGSVRNISLENESVTVQNGAVSFADGPTYLDRNNHSIAISIEETGGMGPLFRSGGFDTLPPGAPTDPNGLIEIMVPVNSVTVPAASLSTILPTLPLSLPDCIVITGLTLTLGAGSITVVATGTKCVPIPLPAIGFTYTLNFNIVPSFEMKDTTTIFDIIPIGAGTLAPSGVAFLAGVFGTTEVEIRLRVIRSIQRMLSNSALVAAASTIGAPTLPEGLILSVRRVLITSSGIAIFPVVGAYGGIINAFLRDLWDGTLLKEMSRAEIFVIFGGAKFFIPDVTVFASLGFDWANVRTVPDGALSRVLNIPRDGTVLREMSDNPVYVISGGQKRWIPDEATLLRFGGWSVVRVVPDGSLANIPDGPQVPSVESADCVRIRADIAQRRDTIRGLQQAKTGLNPRNPLDIAEIRQINAEISKINNEIKALDGQATALGC
jgi:hypothetical protein